MRVILYGKIDSVILSAVADVLDAVCYQTSSLTYTLKMKRHDVVTVKTIINKCLPTASIVNVYEREPRARAMER